MANLWIEGTLTEYYPEVTRDREGLRHMFEGFSWPYRFPSHLSPYVPGVIHEGGELGYALSTSFGAVLDDPAIHPGQPGPVVGGLVVGVRSRMSGLTGSWL